MTDDLRTRIAKVLFALNAGEDWNMEPLVWEEATESYRECWFRQADAVIRELGLQRETGVRSRDGDPVWPTRAWPEMPSNVRRYVTEWTADE